MTVAIGDIHGYADALEEILALVPKDEKLVFLGDYIDRGPDFIRVLDLVWKEVESGRAVALMGNHEDMMIRGTHGDEVAGGNWAMNGGLCTCEQILGTPPGKFPADFIERIRKWIDQHPLFPHMKLYHQDEYAIYVHAGVDPRKSLTRQSKETLLWVREEFTKGNPDKFKNWPLIVHGHTRENADTAMPEYRFNVDRRGVLSALVLPEKRLIQVPKRMTIKPACMDEDNPPPKCNTMEM